MLQQWQAGVQRCTCSTVCLEEDLSVLYVLLSACEPPSFPRVQQNVSSDKNSATARTKVNILLSFVSVRLVNDFTPKKEAREKREVHDRHTMSFTSLPD